MPNPLDEIWKGDKLQRRREATVLERFLNQEAGELRGQGRDQAMVLALDAQYGEGKSWFLSRFRKQLELNHAVAFVDAWVDDANDEPLVTIMSALEDAMRPFLKGKRVRGRLNALSRAALPIIGKAAVGAGGKLVSKIFGDGFAETAGQTVKDASEKDDDDPVAAGVAGAFEGLNDIVDGIGAAMLEQYRARQASRETFKQNLRALAEAIDETDDPRVSPIYVIVDELDRCRPSYAISLLEEIKHLFDVPGVVFVIALHGKQLTHSINAVYGAAFDSRAYLRRFFTRTYELRRLSIEELVVSHFAAGKLETAAFTAPKVWIDGVPTQVEPAKLAGRLLTDWRVTPREAQAIIDALRLFVTNWDPPVPIELPLLLILLLDLVRAEEKGLHAAEASGLGRVSFAVSRDYNKYASQWVKISASDLAEPYRNAMSSNLPALVQMGLSEGMPGYITSVLRDEFARLYRNASPAGEPPMPTWSEYPGRVKELGRFVEQPEETEGQA